jgi:hypothetical protein
MHKTILSLVGCSGSIASILASATIANPDTAKTIPYPEVMNLTQVPRFNDRGIIDRVRVAKDRSSIPAIVKAKPVKHTTVRSKPAKVVREELVGQSLSQLRLMKKYGIECTSCRNLSPTVMVMGYHSTGL